MRVPLAVQQDTRDWRDGIAGRAFAFLVADLDLIRSIPYGALSTVKGNPRWDPRIKIKHQDKKNGH